MIESDTNNGCAPNNIFEHGSCYTLTSIIIIAEAYNKDNPTTKIILDKKEETLHPGKYKKYLVKQLEEKLNDVCSNQQCWLTQRFMKNVNHETKEEIEKYTFRPTGPGGKFEWLNTMNIDDVMEQYEKKYDDFFYMGTVPIDFDDLKVLNIKEFDYKELISNNKHKIGMIMNLDEHWKSGSHWVSLYADLKKGQIYYFDSYGIRPEKRIRKYMSRLYNLCVNDLNIKNPDIDYNKIRHQYKGSECGVYSINFILRMLRGKTFKEICESRIPDEKINKCRNKYFIKKK
jgi:hypothetical protein